ncbi:hypothetical protein D3C73_178750 [compost metagenome]
MLGQQPLGRPRLPGQTRDPLIELAAGLAHLSHHFLQPLDEAVYAGRDLAEVVSAGHRQTAGQITTAPGQLLHQIAQGEDGAIGQVESHHGDHQHQGSHPKQGQGDLAVERLGHGPDVVEIDIAGQGPAATADIQLVGTALRLSLGLAAVEYLALTVAQGEVTPLPAHLRQQRLELAHVEVIEIGGIGTTGYQDGDHRLAVQLLQRADGDLVVGGGDQLAQSLDPGLVVDDPVHVERHVTDQLDDVVKAGLLQRLLDAGHPEVEIRRQQHLLVDVTGQLLLDQGDLLVDVLGRLGADVATDEVIDAEPGGADGDQDGEQQQNVDFDFEWHGVGPSK